MLLETVNDVWMHWLQRLDNWCPGCAVLWLTRGWGPKWLWELMLVWAVSCLWTRCCKCCSLVALERLLGCHLMASARKGVVRRPKVVSEDILRLALRRAVWIKKKSSHDWCGRLCLVRGCAWLDSSSSALPDGKDTNTMFSSLVWWWGCRPHAAGVVRDTYLPGSGSSAAGLIFGYCLCLYRVGCCYSTGQVKYFCTQEVPLLNISDNEILHYTLKKDL